MTCLVCCGPLIERDGGQQQCPACGYWYAADLLATDPAIWARIQREHLACVECDQTLPGIPRVWANDRGEPIPCPQHGKRVRRRWWKRWLGRSIVSSQ